MKMILYRVCTVSVFNIGIFRLQCKTQSLPMYCTKVILGKDILQYDEIKILHFKAMFI